jgi:Ca2+-binding RTX toxin-like protein
MPNFIINTTDTTSRTLELGENGLISGSGTLYTAGFGVAISGRAQLTISGALHAAGNAIDADFGASETTIVNSGTISSRLDAIRFLGTAGGYIDVLNSGDILAAGVGASAIRTEGEAYVVNSGTIAASGSRAIRVDSGVGLINLKNSGQVIANGEAISGGDLSDTVVNTGLIDGDISLGGARDVFTFLAGTVTGQVNGGAGNDLYTIGNVDANLVEFGNQGNDGVLSHRDWTLGENFENLTLLGQARTGRGNELGNLIEGNTADNLLQGRLGADQLIGAGGDDQLFGGFGGDVLVGGAGDDSLSGGAGNDAFEGGAGADLLSGNAGTDRFLFTAVADSRPDSFDTITDFTRGGERIDLGLIDARPGTAPDDAFTFRGAQAFNAAAQVRIIDLGADVRVEINLTGTSGAEAAFLVRGAGTLTAADFIL